MGGITLELVLKRVDDVLSGQDAMRAELKAVRGEIATVNEKMGGMATTLIGVQRDIRSLQATVATLGIAVDDHTHRLDRIEQRLGIGVTAN